MLILVRDPSGMHGVELRSFRSKYAIGSSRREWKHIYGRNVIAAGRSGVMHGRNVGDIPRECKGGHDHK